MRGIGVASVAPRRRGRWQAIGSVRVGCGGQWPLLTCFLGLAHLASGDAVRAGELFDWAAATATADLDLPEQVPAHLIAPGMRQTWIDRWGPAATPLLWSHAMFLRLGVALGRIDPTRIEEDTR